MRTAPSQALELSRKDRARCLDCVHDVERFAAAPGPGRTAAWRDDLLNALEELGACIHEQYMTAASTEGLLSRVKVEAPRLIPSIVELLERERSLDERVGDLIRWLADLTRPIEVDDIRGELAVITREFRDLLAWETDIVYDAYLVDLGVAD